MFFLFVCFDRFFQIGSVIGNVLIKILSLVCDVLIENYVKKYNKKATTNIKFSNCQTIEMYIFNRCKEFHIAKHY